MIRRLFSFIPFIALNMYFLFYLIILHNTWFNFRFPEKTWSAFLWVEHLRSVHGPVACILEYKKGWVWKLLDIFQGISEVLVLVLVGLVAILLSHIVYKDFIRSKSGFDDHLFVFLFSIFVLTLSVFF